jgi:hypothetical protein
MVLLNRFLWSEIQHQAPAIIHPEDNAASWSQLGTQLAQDFQLFCDLGRSCKSEKGISHW